MADDRLSDNFNRMKTYYATMFLLQHRNEIRKCSVNSLLNIQIKIYFKIAANLIQLHNLY